MTTHNHNVPLLFLSPQETLRIPKQRSNRSKTNSHCQRNPLRGPSRTANSLILDRPRDIRFPTRNCCVKFQYIFIWKQPPASVNADRSVETTTNSNENSFTFKVLNAFQSLFKLLMQMRFSFPVLTTAVYLG